MDKNAQIRKSLAATRLKRATQTPVTRELKLTRFSKAQHEALVRVFLEGKWLYNHLITTESWRTWDTKNTSVPVRLPNGTFEEREFRHLGSQVKQKIVKQIEASLRALAALKSKGKKVGALRPTRSYNSLQFIQHNTSWRLRGNKIKLQGLPGWFVVRGQEQLSGLELSSAKLIQRSSGYYLKVTGWKALETQSSEAEPLGLDFGIKTHITASDGREWSSMVREPERLKRLQRKLQRQVKGSKNRAKTLRLIGVEYEKLTHRKDDVANKIVHELKAHALIVMQDEQLNSWKVQYGRSVQHSILGRVKTKLSRLPQTVALDRFAPTTQYCGKCGSLNKIPLSERHYVCSCGYEAPRDVHAARNMLILYSFSPVERGGAPVDWKAAIASVASGKSCQDEAGNETAYEHSRSTAGVASEETRLSSAVA